MSAIQQQIKQQRTLRARRVRAKIIGTASRPRLSVRVTNRHIIAQLVNDERGVTIAAATTLKKGTTNNLTEGAKQVGTELAGAAKQHKIKQAVFDRGHKLYHGRVKALADAARANGLTF